MNTSLPDLLDTQRAFDSVAADYDGPRGNNALIQDMRHDMWQWLDRCFPAASRLIDLGCGTGLDAVRMATLGHHVTAIDWSPRMVERTLQRARDNGVGSRVTPLALGAHQLEQLAGQGNYDGAWSNLGPLNCIADLHGVADHCARLIRPGGRLVFTVIGRYCPWELVHYARQGRWRRAAIRFSRDMVPVGMNGHTIWTCYHTPRSFARAFAGSFHVQHVRGVCTFAPPPYLEPWAQRHPRLYHWLRRADRVSAGWPLLRQLGDHFLLVLIRR